MNNGEAAGGFGVAKHPYLYAGLAAGLLPSHPQAYQPELWQLALLVMSRLPQ